MADAVDNVTFVTGDCRVEMAGMEAGSVNLVFGSPPYEDCRTYGIEFAMTGQDWVDWMVAVVQASLRVCRGLVAFVVEGKTRDFRWSATPALLMADLHRAGICLRKPPLYERWGISGSGGPDWWRNRYEFVVCATNGGRLPWSENTAMGNPPKFGVGGAVSNRLQDGGRANFRRTRESPETKVFRNPEISNPGNVIDCGAVGGGNIGDELAHENEAPFPEYLAESFVRSFCPPDGTVLDPFSGSGTTVAVACKWGRKGIGIDIRQSQTELAAKRIGRALRPATYQDRSEPQPGAAPLFEETKP